MPIEKTKAFPQTRQIIPKLEILAVGLLLLAVTVGLQYFTGAFQSDLGGEPDESAHFLNGLCLYDYVATGFPGNPIHYLKDYYQHYPKVALGHWPPLFAIGQALWMLVFSAGRTSALLFMGALTAGIATTIFALLKPRLGPLAAITGATVFLWLPLVQWCSVTVMTEIPMTVLCLLATLAWARFLESEKTSYAITFGVLAGLALLTKQPAMALAAVPVISVVITGKWMILKRRAFWLPALIVLAFCGPWYWLVPKLTDLRWSWDATWGWDFTKTAIPYYLTKFYQAMGVGLLVLMCIGICTRFTSAQKRQDYSIWAALAGLLAGILVVHMTIPVAYEARYLLPALPAAIAFAAVGGRDIFQWLNHRGLSRTFAAGIVLALLLIALGIQFHTSVKKTWHGWSLAADWVLAQPMAKNSSILIASDSRGEGMFVSEVAVREKRPGSVVRRGSKELATSTWNGTRYRVKKMDSVSLLEITTREQIEFIVIDNSIPNDSRLEHLWILEKVLKTDPEHFVLQKMFDAQRGKQLYPDAIRIYRVAALAIPEP